MRVVHTPEEMRKLSNRGHWVEGGLLGIVGILALMQLWVMEAWVGVLLPVLLLKVGLLLVVFMYAHHPPTDWPLIWADPQSKQHTIMATLLSLAGLVELLRAVGIAAGSSWAFVWPLVLIVVGIMFMIHTQHGNHTAMAQAVRSHRILGITIVGGGLIKSVHVLWSGTIFAYLWPLLLLAAAIQLLIYREPEGAYANAGHGKD